MQFYSAFPILENLENVLLHLSLSDFVIDLTKMKKVYSIATLMQSRNVHVRGFWHIYQGHVPGSENN